MIKELFLAIALGAILGFGITGGFFAFKKNKTPTTPPNSVVNIDNSSVPTETISVTPTTTPQENNAQLTIDSPENETVVNTSKVNIKGTTNPDSLIIIRTPSKTFTANSDASGNFDTDIDLETGVNLIKISAINTNDEQKDTELTITYSTANI